MGHRTNRVGWIVRYRDLGGMRWVGGYCAVIQICPLLLSVKASRDSSVKDARGDPWGRGTAILSISSATRRAIVLGFWVRSKRG